jgi:hypothetical protein
VGSPFASSLSQNRICLSEFEVACLIDHYTLELMLADRCRLARVARGPRSSMKSLAVDVAAAVLATAGCRLPVTILV